MLRRCRQRIDLAGSLCHSSLHDSHSACVFYLQFSDQILFPTSFLCWPSLVRCMCVHVLEGKIKFEGIEAEQHSNVGVVETRL